MDERIRWSRHADSPSQTFLRALFPTLVLLLIAPAVGDALEVTTNITHTSGAGDLGTLVSHLHDNVYDNVYDITGGTRLVMAPTSSIALETSVSDLVISPTF